MTNSKNTWRFYEDTWNVKITPDGIVKFVLNTTNNVEKLLEDTNTIKAPIIDRVSDRTIDLEFNWINEPSWIRNATIKLYEDSDLTQLYWASSIGDFSWLSPETKYYAVVTVEVMNEEHVQFELKTSSITEITTASTDVIY